MSPALGLSFHEDSLSTCWRKLLDVSECVSRRETGRRRDMKDTKGIKEMDLDLLGYSEGSRERLDTVQNSTTLGEDHLSKRAQQYASELVCDFGQILCWQSCFILK